MEQRFDDGGEETGVVVAEPQEPSTKGILLTEQGAAIVPVSPWQDQVKTLVPVVTDEAVPAVHRFDDGATVTGVDVAEPQEPTTAVAALRVGVQVPVFVT